MADIKQAAKWMLEGKTVLNGDGWAAEVPPGFSLIYTPGTMDPFAFSPEELLAEDWEIRARKI